MNGEDTPIITSNGKNIVNRSTLIAEKGDIHVGDNIQLAPKEIVFPNQDVKPPAPYISRRFLKPSQKDQGDLFNRFFYKDILQELDEQSHIILLGDAGFGKSTELKRIQFDIAKEGTYQVARYELKNLESEGASLPHFKLSIPDRAEIDKRILLLDGLDEVNFEKALKSINLLKEEYPELKTIVTCRTIVYNDSLSGFESYHIQRLSDEELDQFLAQVIPEVKGKFLADIPSPEIKELLRIPFYLEKTISYYLANQNSLPKGKIDLLQHFINESLKVRIGDKSNIIKEEDLRRRCLKELEKVAFVLECLGKNSLPQEDFWNLVNQTDEDIDLAFNKASLIHFQNNQFQFAHRIIQEYLAAFALSKAKDLKKIKRVIAVKPDLQKVKTTWINSLSDLWSLMETGSSMKSVFFKWLLKHNPEIIIKFEREKFSPDERDKILRIVYKQYQENEISFDFNLFYPSELASFSQSYSSFRFLFEELKSVKNLSEKNNILGLLRNFHSQFFPNDLREEFRLEIFKNIYDFEVNSSYIRYLAIDVLLHFYSNLSESEVSKLVDTFFDSKDAYERLSAYKAIWKSGNQKNFIELLLKRLLQLEDKNWRGEHNLANEDFHLEKCFKNLDSEEELVAYFESYPKIFEDRGGYHIKDYLGDLLVKASAKDISQEGHNKIFQSLKEKLAENINYTFRGIGSACIDYLEKSQQVEDVIVFCLNSPILLYQRVVAFFMNNERIPLILEAYKEGDLDPKWVENLIGCIGRNSQDVMRNLVVELNKIADSPFEMPSPPPNIDPEVEEKRKREKLEREKDLYFSQGGYLEMVVEIFDFFGKEKLNKGEVFYRSDSFQEGERFYQRYPHAILHQINDLSHFKKDEIIHRISKNWELVSISKLKKFLEGNKELVLSDGEVQIVKDWCDRHSKKMNLDDKVTNGDIVFAWYTLRYDFLHYEDRIYVDMIGVGLQGHLGPDLDLVKFALEKKVVSFDLVKGKILKTIKDQKIQGYELSKHLEYAKEYKIVDALPLFSKFIENAEEDSLHRRRALEGYIGCDGNEEYIWDILETIPHTDDLENQIIDFCMIKNPVATEKVLLKKFRTAEDQAQKLYYSKFLLQLSNLASLKFIVDYTKESKKSPLPFDWRRDSIEFNNIKGIKYLLKLYDLGFHPQMSQDDIDSIPRKVQSMIYHLALSNDGDFFFQVQKKINSFVFWNNLYNHLPKTLKQFFPGVQENTINSLKYFSRDLSYRYYQSRYLSLDEAIDLYNKLT